MNTFNFTRFALPKKCKKNIFLSSLLSIARNKLQKTNPKLQSSCQVISPKICWQNQYCHFSRIHYVTIIHGVLSKSVAQLLKISKFMCVEPTYLTQSTCPPSTLLCQPMGTCIAVVWTPSLSPLTVSLPPIILQPASTLKSRKC